MGSLNGIISVRFENPQEKMLKHLTVYMFLQMQTLNTTANEIPLQEINKRKEIIKKN